MSEKIDIQELRRAVMNNAKRSKISIKNYLDLYDIPENMYYAHIGNTNTPRDYKYIVAYKEMIQQYKKS